MSDNAYNNAMGLAVAICNNLNKILRNKRKTDSKWSPTNKVFSLVGNAGQITKLFPDINIPIDNRIQISDAYAIFNNIKWVPYVPTTQYNTGFGYIKVSNAGMVFTQEGEGTGCYKHAGGPVLETDTERTTYSSLLDKTTLVFDGSSYKYLSSKDSESTEDYKTIAIKSDLSYIGWYYSMAVEGEIPECPDNKLSCCTSTLESEDTTSVNNTVTSGEMLAAFGINTPGYSKLVKLLSGISVIELQCVSSYGIAITEVTYSGCWPRYECAIHPEEFNTGSSAESKSPLVYADDENGFNPNILNKHCFAKGTLSGDSYSHFRGITKTGNNTVNLVSGTGLKYYPDIAYLYAHASFSGTNTLCPQARVPGLITVYL